MFDNIYSNSFSLNFISLVTNAISSIHCAIVS